MKKYFLLFPPPPQTLPQHARLTVSFQRIVSPLRVLLCRGCYCFTAIDSQLGLGLCYSQRCGLVSPTMYFFPHRGSARLIHVIPLRRYVQVAANGDFQIPALSSFTSTLLESTGSAANHIGAGVAQLSLQSTSCPYLSANTPATFRNSHSSAMASSPFLDVTLSW